MHNNNFLHLEAFQLNFQQELKAKHYLNLNFNVDYVFS